MAHINSYWLMERPWRICASLVGNAWFVCMQLIIRSGPLAQVSSSTSWNAGTHPSPYSLVSRLSAKIIASWPGNEATLTLTIALPTWISYGINWISVVWVWLLSHFLLYRLVPLRLLMANWILAVASHGVALHTSSILCQLFKLSLIAEACH